jgi:hypothetical protein
VEDFGLVIYSLET